MAIGAVLFTMTVPLFGWSELLGNLPFLRDHVRALHRAERRRLARETESATPPRSRWTALSTDEKTGGSTRYAFTD